jgi:hypothetical protein
MLTYSSPKAEPVIPQPALGGKYMNKDKYRVGLMR